MKGSGFSNTIIHDIKNPLNFKELDNTDLIFHLAAQTSSIISQENPSLDINTNIHGTLNIVDFAIEKKCPVIFTSSMAVYNSSKINSNTVPCPISNYGISKYAGEFLIKKLEKYNIKYKIFRLFNVYGPGQDMQNLKQGMVSIFLQMALTEKKIIVKGSKHRTRDMVFIDDIVKELMQSVNNIDNSLTNLGTGVSISVEKLLFIITNAIKRKGFSSPNIFYQDGFAEDVNKIYLDKALALKKFISIEEGIELFLKELL